MVFIPAMHGVILLAVVVVVLVVCGWLNQAEKNDVCPVHCIHIQYSVVTPLYIIML